MTIKLPKKKSLHTTIEANSGKQAVADFVVGQFHYLSSRFTLASPSPSSSSSLDIIDDAPQILVNHPVFDPFITGFLALQLANHDYLLAFTLSTSPGLPASQPN